jgi:hypothetical protein
MRILYLFIPGLLLLVSCQTKQISQQKNSKTDSIAMNTNFIGNEFEFSFTAGTAHNHPSFALWIEDANGNFIQTLFVTKSVASGIFGHAQGPDGTWKPTPGEGYRPAALPFWSHRQTETKTIQSSPSTQNSMPDALTGATPKADFKLSTRSKTIVNQPYKIFFEINQPWDWNEYWNNSKYPDDKDYMTSCQPSIVYSVTIDNNNAGSEYFLHPIGHGNYAGKDGKLYSDLSSITSALHLVENVKITTK